MLASTEPLQIRLDDLCGVADVTTASLNALAADGTLTPESAARLAVRHSKEIGLWSGYREVSSRNAIGRFDLAISGDVLGSFAIRIGSGAELPWIGSATAKSLGKLLDVCPEGQRAICLLVGPVIPAGTTVRIVTTPEWRVTLIGRSLRPGWCLHTHPIVIGNLPKDLALQNAICRDLKATLGRRPDLEFLMPPGYQAAKGPLPSPHATKTILSLLAIALPGLLRADGDGSPR